MLLEIDLETGEQVILSIYQFGIAEDGNETGEEGLWAEISVSGLRAPVEYFLVACSAIALATISDSCIIDESKFWFNRRMVKPHEAKKLLHAIPNKIALQDFAKAFFENLPKGVVNRD
jgi:hypothetical protein